MVILGCCEKPSPTVPDATLSALHHLVNSTPLDLCQFLWLHLGPEQPVAGRHNLLPGLGALSAWGVRARMDSTPLVTSRVWMAPTSGPHRNPQAQWVAWAENSGKVTHLPCSPRTKAESHCGIH